MPDNQIEKVHGFMEGFNTAMLITHAQPARARPMAIARVEPNCDLWFFTGHDSSKVHEIESDPRVLIVCQDERSRYLSLSGTSELISDHAKIRELWRESYKTWFPRGVDDPDILLIFVHAEQAEYWDSQGANGIKYMFQAAKAYATGTTPQIREGEQHGQVALH